MKKLSYTLRVSILLGLFLFGLNLQSQTRIKSMFYNLLNYENSSVSRTKTPHLKTILDNVNPDLLMVCELKDGIASDYLFNNAIDTHNSDFEKATFQNSMSTASGGLTQMVYYNGKKLVLESSNIITTNTRDINHYTFKINTTDVATNPIKLEVFVTHLKASTGSSNRNRRLQSINDFFTTVNNLNANSYVIFAGDFNFYTSNEEGYQKLISNTNQIVMVDPINRPTPAFPNNGVDYFDPNNYNSTYFWNNSSFKDVHTQSTRTSNSGLIDQSGSTGGLDDRFDFIMMSKNFQTDTNLFYVNNSYKTVGNNGNCYNTFISNSNCTGTYSQSLRNSLLEFSDHLPVVMEIETPRNTLSNKNYEAVTVLGSNMAENTITLNSTINLSSKTLKIYNQLGQLVKTVIIKNDNKKQTINVAKLSKGIYYITPENSMRPIKFIKL